MKNSVIIFRDPPRIVASASAVGAEEAKGPLGKQFDFSDPTDRFGGDTWEHAEACLAGVVFSLLMNKAKFDHRQVDMLFAGDLQNQCVASSEGLMGFGIPFVGLYGACSTCGEGLMQAALALSVTNGIRYAVSLTTSHYCAAERQYRTPLEYGCQRPPTAQWTATAGGGFLLTKEKRGWVEVEAVMPGRIVDSGIRDASNMGAAMAPAVVDSLHRYFEARDERPTDYDAIITGDLAKEGSSILEKMLNQEGVSIKNNHFDCGKLLYDYDTQDVHAGASGCGCSASVLSAHFLPKMERGELGRVLFVATGALMSPSSLLQGGNISGIAPVVCLRTADKQTS